MRWKSTLFLVLANLVVFSSFYIVSKKSPLLEAMEDHISSGLLKDIAWIEMQTATEMYRFERRVQDWEVVKPRRWPTNSFAIEKFLTQLRFLGKEISFSVETILKSGQTLADYGLQKPLLTLTLGTHKQELNLKIGQQTQVGNRLYVLDEKTQHIIAVKKEGLDTLLMPKENWYNSFLVSNALGDVHSIRFKSKLSQVLLINEGKEWLFKTPITAKANTLKVELLLEEIQNINIVKFLDFPPVENSENKDYTLTLVGENFNYDITLHAMPKEENTYWGKLGDYDRIFLIRTYAINRLLEAPETLREHRVLSFDSESIQEIIYSENDKKIGLQRVHEHQWKIFASLQVPMKNDKADNAKVSRLLSYLSSLTAERFVNDMPTLEDLKALGLDETCAKRLTIKNQQQSYELLLAEKDGPFYAKFANEPCVFELHPSYKDYLDIHLSDYQDKTIWKWLPIEQMRSFEISYYDKSLFKYVFVPKNNQWECLIGNDPENKIINFILNHTKTLKAKKHLTVCSPFQWPFVTNADMFLWPYCVKIQTFDGVHTRHYSLWLSSRLGGSLQIAKYGVQMFCLTQNWINVLFKILEGQDLEKSAHLLNPTP